MSDEALTITNSDRDPADFDDLLGVDRDQSAMSHLLEDLGGPM